MQWHFVNYVQIFRRPIARVLGIHIYPDWWNPASSDIKYSSGFKRPSWTILSSHLQCWRRLSLSGNFNSWTHVILYALMLKDLSTCWHVVCDKLTCCDSLWVDFCGLLEIRCWISLTTSGVWSNLGLCFFDRACFAPFLYQALNGMFCWCFYLWVFFQECLLRFLNWSSAQIGFHNHYSLLQQKHYP